VGSADVKAAAAIQVTPAGGPLRTDQLLADRYLVTAELGRGLSGVVYRALDQHARVAVALKVLHQSWSGPQAAERLFRELRFGRSLCHPHVCHIHEAFESDGRFILVMAHASAGTLRTTLTGRQAGPGTEEQLADARAVIAGLAAIHRAGVVHRDLKPENVLRLSDGRLVISDFGLARALEQGTSTCTGLGTPGYLAPEILAGARADQACDVWSLGVILHEILGGARPTWVGGRVRTRLPRRARGGARATALARVCVGCLVVDRDLRPATGSDVEALLEETVRKQLRRSRIGAVAIGLCLLAAGPVAVVASRMVDRRADPTPPAQLGEDWSASLLVYRPPVGHGRQPLSLPCWQPVGPDRRVVRAAHSLHPPGNVVDIDIHTGRKRQEPVDGESYRSGCPDLAPDGRGLLFPRRLDGALHVMYAPNPDGVGAVRLLRGNHATWLPGGKSFLYVTETGDLATGDLQGRRRVVAAGTRTAATVEQLAVDDRGERAALRTRPGGANAGDWLELFDLRTSRQLGSWPLGASGQLHFDRERGAFQVPLMRAGVQILAELRGDRELVAVGHIPGLAIHGSVRVPGGRLIAAVRPGPAPTVLIRRDGSEQIIAFGAVEFPSSAHAGEVLYAQPSPAGADLRRVMYWRPGPPASTELLTEGAGIGVPTISADGRWAIYYELKPERRFFHCDLAGPARPDRCQPVHVDPQLHDMPAPGPVGPDGDAFPYFAAVPDPAAGERPRVKVLRVLFLRSRAVLELGPMEASCGLIWSSERTLWLLRDGDPHWRELDIWSSWTDRRWPRHPVTPCYSVPPGPRPVSGFQKQSPWELRFVPDRP
jgi:hypothetical protein